MILRNYNLSLRNRLILISVTSSLLALLIVLGFHAFQDSHKTREDFLLRQQILAEVLVKNTRASLAFADSKRGGLTLATLSAEPNVMQAILYDRTGQPLVAYPPGSEHETEIVETGDANYLFTNDALHLYVPVDLDGELIGKLYVRTRLVELKQNILWNAADLLLISIFASVLAALLASYMQKSLSGRVISLSRLADYIRQGGSWHSFTHIEDFGQDEIGRLGNAFNDMLEKLENREADIKESESRYRTLVEAAPFSMFELDPKAKILSSNRNGLFEAISYGKLSSRKYFSLIDKKDRRRVFELWKQVLDGKLVEFDLDLRINKRLINITTSLIPLRDKQQNIHKIMGITQDISHRVSLEKQLRHAQKMEAVGQLTSGVAHDLNNILGIMVGNIELLKFFQESKNPDAEERITEIEQSIKRAEKLTNQLMAITRDKRVEVERVNLNDRIRKQKNLHASTLTPDVEVHYQLQDGLWDTEINSGDFEDALLNLIINARDAMSGHGKLHLETCNRILDEDFCRSRADLSPGEYVELMVTDSGEGMSPTVVEHIFEPFYTTKQPGKGTGLGLAMVFGFVQRSKGAIHVYSEPGTGTTFDLYFPRKKSASNQSVSFSEASGKATQVPGGNETLLVVDDEQALLELSCAQLERLGYKVIPTTDANQALAILKSRNDISLLFSDVVMPGELNGYKLAAKAREYSPEIKVLLTSGFPGAANIHQQQTLSREEVLKKPFALHGLALAVRRTLDES